MGYNRGGGVVPKRFNPLKAFRAEFAVAHSGANFHLRPNCRDCPDNFSALIRRDAVPASQRRVQSEHVRRHVHGFTSEMPRPSTFLVLRVANVSR